MAVKARQRIKHVKEEDITNPVSSGGMCSNKKSSAVIMAEARERDEKGAEDQNKLPSSDVNTSHAFTEGRPLDNEDTNKGGDSNVEETITSSTDTIEPNGTSPVTEGNSEVPEGGGEGTRVTVEQTVEQKRREDFSKKRLSEINEGARVILSCLEPQFAQEFYTAAKDYKVADIGIYVLGILNRLSKQADYYDIDFEPEWEQGDVGFTDKLFCQYCNKEIIKPTRMKQKFCSNLCARYNKERNDTGLTFPDQTVEGQTVEEQEADAKLEELKRLGE